MTTPSTATPPTCTPPNTHAPIRRHSLSQQDTISVSLLYAQRSYYQNFADTVKATSQIAYYLWQTGFITNEIVTYYVNDTIPGKYDSAIYAIQSKEGAMSSAYQAQVAQLQINAAEYSAAASSLTNLGNSDATYNNFCRLMNILITLKENPKGYFALKGDSANTAIVNSIATDSTQTGYANARALMTLVFHKQYAATIYPMSHNTERIISGQNIPTAQKNQYSLYPNPANNVLTVESLNTNNSMRR